MMAKQAQPDEPHIADTLGWVYYKRKSYSLAIPQFEMALRTRPGDPIITYHLALALHGDGQSDRAAEVLKPLIEQETDFPDREKAQALFEQLESQS
jgi:predicted Zn-dependent protease